MGKHIGVRTIMSYTSDEVFKGLHGRYNIMFEDDKAVIVTSKELIISRYFWEIFEMFPEVPIVSDYLISNYYKNGMYTTSTHNNFFNRVLKDISLQYLIPNNKMSPVIMDKIYKKMYQIINRIYNDVVYNILEYISTINIINVLEIQFDTDLIKAIDIVKKNPNIKTIQKAYNVLDDVMYKDKYRDNPLAKAYIAGIINANQVKQVLGPRGYTTELNGTIFKYPIYNSFSLGLNNLYDLSTESRSAAKSLHLSTAGIQQSEWFARELQLLTMVLKSIDWTDCGNDKYITWYVRDKEIAENGSIKYSGDLDRLLGKIYLDEELGIERYIDENSTDLIGKTIKIRSVKDCRCSDKSKICYKCFGALSYTIPQHFNLGHYTATYTSSKISQGILSNKHLTASATSDSITLDDIASKFFIIKNGNKYCLQQQWLSVKKNLKIEIAQNQCFGLKDIKDPNDVNKIDPSRTTRVENFVLIVDDKDRYSITVKSGANYAVFEPKFLSFIIETGYNYDNKDRYIIDISRWRSPTALFTIPDTEYSFFNFSKDVKSLIQTRSPLQGMVSRDTQESLIFKLFNLINSKLTINLSIIESIVYCLTVQDYPEMNLDLARNSHNPQLADLKSILSYRSLSAGYAHSELISKLYDPLSFHNHNRPDHLLDVLIRPNDVIKEKYSFMFN